MSREVNGLLENDGGAKGDCQIEVSILDEEHCIVTICDMSRSVINMCDV